MRHLHAVILGLLAIFTLPVMAAPPDDKAVDPREAAKAQIDEALQNVFNNADKNHNFELSRIEFKRAQVGLEATVEQLVQNGLIGMPPVPDKRKKKKAEEEQPAGPPIDVEKLAKSNHVTQVEFTTYAQAIVREVDQQWQQARALAQSQREAWQNLRRMRSNARRRAVNPGFAY